VSTISEWPCRLRLRRSEGSLAPWRFVDGNKAVEAIVSGPVIAQPTLLGAALQGLGLAQVPGPLVKDPVAERRLEALLSPLPSQPGVFLYYPSRRRALPKLRAFIEHMKGRSGRIGKTSIRNRRSSS
jgi:DNA-binding transcriptional LysR family regulator